MPVHAVGSKRPADVGPVLGLCVLKMGQRMAARRDWVERLNQQAFPAYSVSFFRRVDLKLDQVGIVLPAANELMSFSVHQYLRR